MPIRDAEKPFSDSWWLERLARKLSARVEDSYVGDDERPGLRTLWNYYDGRPPLAKGLEHAAEAYRQFLKKSRLNVAELVVESARERMTPLGFVTPDGDPNGDDEARAIWDGNDLDVEIADVLTNMLAMRDSYVIVAPPPPGSDIPIITGEDPRQVVTIHDPVRQRDVRAGGKFFHDPDMGRDFGFLYMPPEEPGGRAYYRIASHKREALNPAGRVVFNAMTWDWLTERIELPVDRCPVVRFRNRHGVAEFERHLSLLDRINHMILQRLVVVALQAFRQRAIKNAPIRDPDTGEEIDYEAIMVSAPDSLWRLPEGAELWESAITDIGPIVNSVKDDLRDAAALMRFPLTYITPDAAVGSAEGASLQREGLVFRTEDRIMRAQAACLDFMALAFAYRGDAVRSQRGSLSMLWAPVERYSLAERADAASKAPTSLPQEAIWTDIWQYRPVEVERLRSQRATDAFIGALGAGQAALPAETATPAPAETGTEVTTT